MRAFGIAKNVIGEDLVAARGEMSSLAVDYLPELAIAQFDAALGSFDFHSRARQLFFPRPIPPSFPVLARACL